jgi:hypothetical protein
VETSLLDRRSTAVVESVKPFVNTRFSGYIVSNIPVASKMELIERVHLVEIVKGSCLNGSSDEFAKVVAKSTSSEVDT